MKLAWKSLRGWWITALGAALGLATVVVRDLSVLLPIISGGSPFGAVPASAITPLLLVIAIGTVQAQAAPPPVEVSVRPFPLLCLLVLSTGTASFAVSYLLTSVVTDQALLFDPYRNVMAYAALLVIARLVVSVTLAPFIPALYLFVSTVFGRGPNGTAMPWAWPTQSASAADTLVALMTLTVLVAVTAARLAARPSR